jgi:hypothetical protein
LNRGRRTSLFTRKDRDFIERGRAVRNPSYGIILGTPRRCGWGAPQVLACAAEKKSLPFPTTYWLSCPFLARVAARLEAENGVRSMENLLESRAAEWGRFNLLFARLRLSIMRTGRKNFARRYARRRFDALRRGGVGGIALSGRIAVKCIHLQMASYLGTGFHPASDWMSERIARWECTDGFCAVKREEALT